MCGAYLRWRQYWCRESNPASHQLSERIEINYQKILFPVFKRLEVIKSFLLGFKHLLTPLEVSVCKGVIRVSKRIALNLNGIHRNLLLCGAYLRWRQLSSKGFDPSASRLALTQHTHSSNKNVIENGSHYETQSFLEPVWRLSPNSHQIFRKSSELLKDSLRFRFSRFSADLLHFSTGLRKRFALHSNQLTHPSHPFFFFFPYLLSFGCCLMRQKIIFPIWPLNSSSPGAILTFLGSILYIWRQKRGLLAPVKSIFGFFECQKLV